MGHGAVIESAVGLLLFSTVIAAIASLALRYRVGLLGCVGLGYLANLLASGVRHWLRVDTIDGLGPVDPALWILGSALLILLPLKFMMRLRRVSEGPGTT